MSSNEGDKRLYVYMRNQGRFAVEQQELLQLWRVIDLGTNSQPTTIPLTDWVAEEVALVMRYDYQMGYLTP